MGKLKLSNFFNYLFAKQTLLSLFFFFLIIATSFIFIFPYYLYPDFDSLDKYFRHVLTALFSGSEVVKSFTYGGRLQEHKLLFDQLFLTPQLKFIQLVNVFYDLSIIQNTSVYSMFVRLYFLFINFLIIYFIIFVDRFLSEKNQSNYKNNLIFVSTLMFPSILITISTPSSEAVFSILIIFLFTKIFNEKLNIKQIIFYLIVWSYSYLLDSGNWTLTFLYLFNIVVSFLLMKFNRTIFYIIFFLVILVIFLSVNDIINHIIEITDSNKLKRIAGDIQNTSIQYRDPIEIFKRYVYLLLTMSTILLSNKDMIIISLIFNTYIFLFFIRGMVRNNLSNTKKLDDFTLIQLINLISFPLIIIYVLPLHAFGKYYIFLIPIFFKILSRFLNFNNLISFNITFIFCFLINLFLIYKI